MKKMYIMFGLVLLRTVTMIAQNVLTEDFNYNPIDSLENSGNWYRSGIDSKFNIKVVSTGLIFNNYVGSGIGNSCEITNNGAGDVVISNLKNPIISESAYLSFLFTVDSLPATVSNGFFIAFNEYNHGTNNNTALNIQRLNDNNFKLGISKDIENTNISNKVYERGKTYLVVLKYAYRPGDHNDSCQYYVFDKTIPNTEPATPELSINDYPDLNGQVSVVLNNNYAQGGLLGIKLRVDGIRVGNSWETSVLSKSTSVSNIENTAMSKIEIFPNPSNAKCNIKYEVSTKGFVRMQIFNSNGLLYGEPIHEIQESGNHHYIWNASDLPEGMYFCKMQINGVESIQKISLIR